MYKKVIYAKIIHIALYIYVFLFICIYLHTIKTKILKLVPGSKYITFFQKKQKLTVLLIIAQLFPSVSRDVSGYRKNHRKATKN